MNTDFNRRLSIAPMLDWTDRHCRYFHRLLTQYTVLYTEMVTTGAILYGKMDLLQFHTAEQPVVLQLGGSDPAAMAECTRIAAERGYREVNINVGCPSDRVQNGRFGACLMAEPDTVAACVAAMQAAAPDIVISVKTRLGIDEHDSDEYLQGFLEPVIDAGCQHFTLHARNAWLKGLSPKQNRDIPPLRYDRVYRMKERYPQLHITLNGGVKTMAEIRQHLAHVDGVMVGREAYQNPMLLTQFDAEYGAPREVDIEQVIEAMIQYTEAHVAQGGRPWHVVRHMIGLFQGGPGAKKWRQLLSQRGPQATDVRELLSAAYAEVGQARALFAQ
ncbi:tRNA-U16,U17-dihydrouridine synthase [Pseudidiomarina indica]|uniref:tRNA-dihydrouridine(20/20a) synthase n=1 Tax=Pseudidiomarina indica TaxID=1159017 RepID=A0A1G6B1S2_9GAMM|nr:tRNA dihydrouridine(20/20a) synthase DusA [Pseudidiomarina indica]SDB14439.1 tRNA-U16,U17-dihydrouridine synthase [Pseudidiomarina indica]